MATAFTSIIGFDPEYINEEQTYEVYIYHKQRCEKQIFTTVTCILDNVDEWISDAESDSQAYKYRLIVGLEIKFTASGRVALVVLCVCRSCLIFEAAYAPTLPKSLANFLSNHDITFVGVNLRPKLEKLGSEYPLALQGGIGYHDLGQLADERYNREDLSHVGVSELRTFFYGFDLHRPEVVEDDWDSAMLSSDHVHHATLDAFVCYEIGSYIVYPTVRGEDGWAWRLRTEPKALWVKVIDSKYNLYSAGAPDNSANRNMASTWWNMLYDMFLSNAANPWFNNNMLRILGNGERSYLWHDRWSDEPALKERFPRLFTISDNKDARISEAGEWTNGKWNWNIQWRRTLFSWEEILAEQLHGELEHTNLQESSPDTWRWKLTGDGRYSTKSAYGGQEISAQSQQLREDAQDALRLIWNKTTPSKYSGLAWKVIRGRIATRNELVKRNILNNSSDTSCALCGAVEENIHHLFFGCEVSNKIWRLHSTWLSNNSPLQVTTAAHFHQFCGSLGPKRKKFILECIWCLTVWYIWNARNRKVFANEEPKPEKMFDEIRAKAWSIFYLQRECPPSASFHDWCANPRAICE